MRLALLQAGYRNRFSHPAPPMRVRYQAWSIEVLGSPDFGALRYWHDRPSRAEGLEGLPEPDQGF